VKFFGGNELRSIQNFIMVIILFGSPGVGKNYVGEILKNDFDFFFYDGDELLTLEMKNYIKLGKDLPDVLATDYLQRKKEKFLELKSEYPKLALAEPLPKHLGQNYMFELFPNAIFIRIISPIDVIYQRVSERKDHPVNIAYVKKLANVFEEPVIPHQVLCNDAGIQKIKIQLNKILNIA